MITLSKAIHCQDYREMIEIAVGFVKERRPRGSIQLLAKATGCHSTYIAQVLRKERDLSLEQGLALANAFGWSPDVKEYFLLLLQMGRAGNQELKKYFKNKITLFTEESLDLSPRDRALKGGLESQYEAEYFGDHRYQLLHALCLLGKDLKTSELIKLTSLSEVDLDYILSRLELMNLVKLEKKIWKGTENFLHLSKASPAIHKLHETWLSRVISDLNKIHDQNTRYSGLVLLSEEDIVLVREEIVKLINRVREIATKSKGGKISILSIHHYQAYNL